MVFSVLVSVAVSVNAADGYNLVWSDEFDGNGVNPYNWSLDQGVRNGERQTYTLDNASTQNGKLIIRGDCTVIDSNGNVMPDGEVSNYTKDVKSASLHSCGKQAFKFGKVEIRAKLPNACSAWPAFWTCGWDKYGMDAGQGGSNWPCNGEIDFMEMMCVNSDNEPKSPWGKQNTDKSYEAHLHTGPKYIKDTGEYYDGYLEGTRGYSDFAIDPGGVSDSQQLAAKWHTYGMIWEKNSIKITFDGVVKFTVDTSNEALLKKAEGKAYYDAYKFMLENYGNPFNDYEHYFLLNLAIGGGGTEYRFYNDEWPQNLAIDYIRVYQKNDGVSTHNATITAGTKYTVNGKTYTTYNHWAGKGLLKGSEIASNWVADPKYGGKQVTESDTLPTESPAASTASTSSTTTTTTQKPTSGVTIDFDNVTAELEKVGGIAANNASSDSTSINSGKSFKTYAWTGSVSDFTTYYAALNISPHIAENANSLSFKSLAVPDNTGSTALAQYGLTIDGKNYWSGSKASDTNGVINSTVQTISVVGKTLYATDGTQKTINASDIPNITKFLVKPTTTESKIYVDDIVIGVGESSSSSTTSTTTTTTTTKTSSTPSTSDSVIIDWGVTSYNGESASHTFGDGYVTAVKASGARLIKATGLSGLSAYKGIKFTVTPNSGNEKTTAIIKINDSDDYKKSFTLGSTGTPTECSVTFDELGVDPSTITEILFGAEGGTATNITFSDVYGFTESAETPTSSTTTTTTTTTQSGSSGETQDGDVILDWSKYDGYSGAGFDKTPDDPTGYIHVTGTKTTSKESQILDLLNWWGWTPAGYDKIQFTAYGSGNVRISYGGVETTSVTLSSEPTIITIDVSSFANTDMGDIVFQMDAGEKGAAIDFNMYIGDVYGIGTGSSSSTSYKVTIDGAEVSFSGIEFTFPAPSSSEKNFVAYTDGKNYYEVNDIISVDSSKAFTSVSYGELKMDTGASIRLGTTLSGIRFYTPIDTTQVDKLTNMGATVQFGTLIAPKDYLTESELTFDLGTGRYADVPFTSKTYFTETGFKGVVGSIVSIKDANIAREFVGRGYAKVTLGSVEKIIYADYANKDIKNNSRSVAFVADAYKNNNSGYASLKDSFKELVDKWAGAYAQKNNGIDMGKVTVVNNATAVSENGALKIGMNQWESDLTVNNYVKINVNGLTEGTITAYKDGWAETGAHYGVEIGGVIYWDTPYASGEIRGTTATAITFTGKNMYSLVDNSLSETGAYDVEKRITSDDLANITAVCIRPGNHTDGQYVYVESVK